MFSVIWEYPPMWIKESGGTLCHVGVYYPTRVQIPVKQAFKCAHPLLVWLNKKFWYAQKDSFCSRCSIPELLEAFPVASPLALKTWWLLSHIQSGRRFLLCMESVLFFVFHFFFALVQSCILSPGDTVSLNIKTGPTESYRIHELWFHVRYAKGYTHNGTFYLEGKGSYFSWSVS